jgi:hypothetical protein
MLWGGRQKPASWNPGPESTDPKWGWVWQHITSAVIWSGADDIIGNQIYNYPGTWMEFEGPTGDFRTPTSQIHCALADTPRGTIISRIAVDSQPSDNTMFGYVGFWVSAGDNEQLGFTYQAATGFASLFRHNDWDIYTITGEDSPSFPYRKTLAMRYDDTGGRDVFVDGEERVTGQAKDGVAYSVDTRKRIQPVNSSSGGARNEYFYTFDERLEDWQIKALHEDPYGWITPYFSLPKRVAVASALTFQLEGWRWRNDDGTEVTATYSQNQDVNDTVNPNAKRRIRFIVEAPEAGIYYPEAAVDGTEDWFPILEV